MPWGRRFKENGDAGVRERTSSEGAVEVCLVANASLVIALVAGPVIFGSAHLKEAEKKLIDREGVAVEAIPLAKIENRGRRGSRSYKLEVEYPVEAQGKLKSQIKVS